MIEMTVNEFNAEFGLSTYGRPRYEIVTDEDVGTYVSRQFEYQAIPRFCNWEQRDEPFDMGEGWSETIKIVKEKNEKV